MPNGGREYELERYFYCFTFNPWLAAFDDAVDERFGRAVYSIEEENPRDNRVLKIWSSDPISI